MHKTMLALIAGAGAVLGIGILAWADSTTVDGMWLMAPFGATAVLIFGVPESPLAQPKNVLLGHLIAAFIGICFSEYAVVAPWSLAVATGLTITIMLLTGTTHPPAGANPMLIMLTGQSWDFLVMPVLAGAVILVLSGYAVKRCRRVIIAAQIK
ncbi:HPP family protein [Chromatiaceae bacterium AAb-1]|jgi:CBS-domain-containing membrane protein|nr:HPP family protein [Chromatiaceae bacterium AAb-1]